MSHCSQSLAYVNESTNQLFACYKLYPGSSSRVHLHEGMSVGKVGCHMCAGLFISSTWAICTMFETSSTYWASGLSHALHAAACHIINSPQVCGI